MELFVDLVDFDADLGIAAHPIDLLTKGGEAVHGLLAGLEVQGHWDDIRLIAACAAEPANARAGKDFFTFRSRQFVDQHDDVPGPERCGQRIPWGIKDAMTKNWTAADRPAQSPRRRARLPTTAALRQDGCAWSAVDQTARGV